MTDIKELHDLTSIKLPDGISEIVRQFQKQEEAQKRLMRSIFPERNNLILKSIFPDKNSLLLKSMFPDRDNLLLQANPHFVELERVATEMRKKWDIWLKPAQDLARRFEEMNAPIREFQNRIRELTTPASEFARKMQELNTPFQSMMAEAKKQLNTPGIRALFTSFKLQSRFWIVSDINLFKEIISLEIESEQELEQFLVSYYTRDNWAAVCALLDNLNISSSPASRVSIIRDCLKTVQLAQGTEINIANVVIPTLIAQIDGMMFDLYELMNRKSLLMQGEKSQKKDEILVESISQVIDFRAADMLHTVIIEGVFRKADAIKKSRAANDNKQGSEFNIFRHKIMHGDRDFLDYGTVENLTRFFLYADFLMQLITRIENGHEQE